MNITPRTKFWVTDPPATYEDPDQGVIFMLVFSDRRKLLDYYRQMPGLPNVARQSPIQRRWSKLQRDVPMLGWNGINIDPDPAGGPSTLIVFKMGGGGEAPEPEAKHPVLDAALVEGT